MKFEDKVGMRTIVQGQQREAADGRASVGHRATVCIKGSQCAAVVVTVILWRF